jgi:hypothetical protein
MSYRLMRKCNNRPEGPPTDSLSHDLVAREEFTKRIFSEAYGEEASVMNNYKLTSLYSVLALGALMELSRPIYSPVTREWMEIAQSSIFGCVGDWEQSVDSIEVRFPWSS